MEMHCAAAAAPLDSQTVIRGAAPSPPALSEQMISVRDILLLSSFNTWRSSLMRDPVSRTKPGPKTCDCPALDKDSHVPSTM